MARSTFYILISLSFLISTLQNASAQDSWDDEILEKANTGEDTRYLKESEKEVIFYTNLARTDGKLFADTYLSLYLETNKLAPDSFISSLFKELQYVKDLPMLYPDKELYDIARGHAIKSGKSGEQGHKGFEKRFKPVEKTFYTYGENCYYGKANSLLIVLDLLIDNGIDDLGHRRNMLDRNFNSVGVSIMPHKEFGYNCVMDFGSR
jgi:hypothetical protein